PPEVRQMTRRLRLGNLQALVDIADAHFSGEQQSQNAQSGLVGQGAEEHGHLAHGPPHGRHISALTNISLPRYRSPSSRSRIQEQAMSDVGQAVRERYGAIASAVSKASANPGCCGPSPCGGGSGDPITSNLYSGAETNGLPADAVTASLGCGNPTALVNLQPGP